MKVKILLNRANKSWIIEKIANKLCDHVIAQGVDARVSDAGLGVRDCDVVHHMSWAFANIKGVVPSTMFITHLDDRYKMQMVKNVLSEYVNLGICMSTDTRRQLIDFGATPESLRVINPAHDGSVAPRRIVIGITSRVYSDGRKREDMLIRLAKKMKLEDFEFRIFGNGWESVAEILRRSDAVVNVFEETNDAIFDYKKMIVEIPKFDYYLYLGMDEGSLGTLDALAAGIPTIVTPQGFHLDIPSGITHSVLNDEDLFNIFMRIAEPRKARILAVGLYTWGSYASKHILLWRGLSGDSVPSWHDPVQQELSSNIVDKIIIMRTVSLKANATDPQRVISAISHLKAFRWARRIIDRYRFGNK